jgi:nitrilase
MKISLIQIESGDDKEANFGKAKNFILEALASNPDIICLPENFLYRGNNKEIEPEELSGGYISAFQELVKGGNTNLILGSIILKTGSANKPTNSCLVINRDGEIIHRYDKQYMYELETDDLRYSESADTQAGCKIGLFELDGIKIGVGICVDLRFPEYFRELVKKGAEVIFLPANFRKLTGQVAWNILTKARAIENQIYFCACDQPGGTGVHERCGNSRVISFDGNIISEIDGQEGIISADLDLEAQRRFRKEFPVLRQIK